MSSSLGVTTFSETVSEIGELVHDTSTARKTPIKQAINRAYDAIAARFDWPQLIFVDESGQRRLSGTAVSTFEDGEAEVPLPYNATDIRSLRLQYQDSTRAPIEVIPAQELYDKIGSKITTTGRPRKAAIIGTTAQFKRLTADDTPVVSSEVSGNDGVASVRIEYTKANAVFAEPSVTTLTGNFSAGVAFPNAVLAGYPIRSVTLPSGWKGAFFIKDSSANNITVIRSVQQPSNQANNEVRVASNMLLRLDRVPDTDYACTVIFMRRPRKLVDDNDVPEIPVSTYLVEKVAAEILRQQNKKAIAAHHESEAAAFVGSVMRQHHRGPMVATPMRGSFTSQSGLTVGR
jgi:hypothetical protein